MVFKNWRKLAVLTLASSAVIGTGTALAAEDYSTWTYNSDITLNTSSTGAAVTGTVLNFPVLVKLSYRNFLFNEAKGNGSDIRFAKTSGLPITYHIESWDSVRNEASVWVKMDTVYGNTAGQVIKMYWGKAGAMDSSKASAVFDTANGFASVYHMTEDPSTGKVMDQTQNAINGTPSNLSAASLVQGNIGKGLEFDGSTSTVNLGNSPKLNFSTAFSFSGWINMSSYNSGDESGLMQKAGSLRYFVRGENDGAHMHKQGIYFGATMGTAKFSETVMPLSQWQYFTFTTDGTNYSFYTNGVLDGTGALGEAILNSTENVVISQAWDRKQGGVYDEFRIDNVMRSPDWVKLSYANQKNYQSLVTLVMTSRCIASYSAPGDTTVNEGSSLVLTTIANCASNVVWSVASGPITALPDSLDRVLKLKLPRVTGDTNLVLHLAVNMPNGLQQKDITVHIKETTPDPIFTFVTGLKWNGTDTMSIIPTISNLAAIKASPSPDLNWVWSIPLSYADTISFDGGMLLRNGYDGVLELNLCLDNGSVPNCKSVSIDVAIPVSIALRPHRSSSRNFQPRFDIMGRRTTELEKVSRLGRPLFLKPENSSTPNK